MQPLRYLTARQAAIYTGRPVGTIWRWASEGRITRHGSGRHARFHLFDLPAKREDALTGQTTPAAPPPLPTGRRAA